MSVAWTILVALISMYGWIFPVLGWLIKDLKTKKMCGKDDYNPSLQCCCDLTLHDLPQHDCQCCGTRAFRWNETKPAECMATCGTQLFHTGTQLCCGRTVLNSSSTSDVCCGTQLINKNTHVCCPDFPLDNRNYGCCYGLLPYHLTAMSCNRTSAFTYLKRRQRFDTQRVCDGALPLFNLTMPAPEVINDSHTHIRGTADSCKITLQDDKRGKRLTIPLSFVMVGRHKDLDCLPSDTMDLVIKLNSGQACARQEEFQKYFQGQVVDVYFRKSPVCRKRSAQPVLRLKDGHNAVMFMAGPTSDLMAQSLHTL